MSVSLRNTPLFTDPNLINYWELENLTDSKGTATLTNTTGKSFVAAKFNNGIDMGSTIRNTTELSVASNIIPAYNASFSISLWFKMNRVLDATNANPGLITLSTGAASGYALAITPEWNAGSPRIKVLRRTSADASDVVSFGNDITTWHHLVTTYNGTTVVSYLDGVAFGSGVASSSNFNAVGYPFLSIGGSFMSSNATAIIDDVSFFNRALTLNDVLVINGAVTTNPVTSISLTTAVGNAEVGTDGGATITERGVCWNTVTNPTTSNNKATTPGTLGAYTINMTGLSVNTLYYVRSYYINALGTTYGNEVTFTTLNINQYELQYPFNAASGDTYVGQITVTGTLGTVTVKLGTTGTSTVINAGAGATAFTGTYDGLSGLIITRSATFNGTIDNVYYAKVPLGTTIDWTLNTVAITTAIPSEVFFKRVEDQVFNNFRFYRYLDLLFKDLDGYVTVTVRQEREDNTTEKTKTFSVGNVNSGTVSPFQKKRISFLCKDQAIIIGLSNENLNETFSIAQYLLIGDKKPRRTISPTKIISV
jgi:hypothetical protein